MLSSKTVWRTGVRLILVAWLLGSAAGRAASSSSDLGTADQAMESLFAGTASFETIVTMQIKTTKTSGGEPFVDGMDEGTQIVPMGDRWYLFNREYDYETPPSQCKADFSRIVVRYSTDQGKSWSSEVVVAQPNIAAGECALGDGFAYYDSSTGTWHYISQMLGGTGSEYAGWNIDHFTLKLPELMRSAQDLPSSPMHAFTPDSRNPVVRGGQLWREICGPGKSCPQDTAEEGTPEISYKMNEYFYVSFHGAYYNGNTGANANTVYGYRGVAKTKDFHTWITSGPDLPNDAVWSSKDCSIWNVAWNPSTGCVGGGHASTLLTNSALYMLIESSDMSLGGTQGQNWVIGLVKADHYVPSGNWQHYVANPLMNMRSGYPIAIQYPRLFQDHGVVYLSYWALGPTGPHDANTQFKIAKLVTGQPQSTRYAPGGLSMASGSTVKLGNFTLAFQTDGNLVFYDQFGWAQWASNTDGMSCDNGGCQANFLANGNLILSGPKGEYWKSGSADRNATSLILSEFPPYLQIQNGSGSVLWRAYGQVGSDSLLRDVLILLPTSRVGP